MTRVTEERVGSALTGRRLTLAVAESCTGGLLGSRITDVSGSSAYFLGGIVAYSNAAKAKLLHIDKGLLATAGAVSEPVAVAMARGARQVLGADIGLGTTGIAGPTGGGPDKPIGLVYIALVAADCEVCEKHIWSGNRAENKEQTAEAALILLERYLSGTV